MKLLPIILFGCVLLAGCSATPSSTETPIEVQMMQTRIIEAQSGVEKINLVITEFEKTIEDAKQGIQDAEQAKQDLHDKAEASREWLKAYGYEKQETKADEAVFQCLQEDGLTFEKYKRDDVDEYVFVDDANVFEGVNGAWVRKSDGANCYRSEIIQ